MNTVTETPVNEIERMFEAGAHYGLPKARRHPSARAFIYGTKEKSDIFDLEKTKEMLERAKAFARKLGEDRKMVLFVGGKPESHAIIKEVAESLDAPYSIGRWIGGTLTNFSEISKRVARLQKLLTDKNSGALAKYTKFERLQIDREIEKLQTMFAGLLPLNDKLPHALFVVDPSYEHIAVEEAKMRNIPVIAIANTDCNFNEVAYPIPANDAAPKSIAFFTQEIAEAYREGLQSVPAEDTAPQVSATK